MPAGPRHVLLPGSFNKQVGGGGTGGMHSEREPRVPLGHSAISLEGEARLH